MNKEILNTFKTNWLLMETSMNLLFNRLFVTHVVHLRIAYSSTCKTVAYCSEKKATFPFYPPLFLHNFALVLFHRCRRRQYFLLRILLVNPSFYTIEASFILYFLPNIHMHGYPEIRRYYNSLLSFLDLPTTL